MILSSIQSDHNMMGLVELDIAPKLASALGLDLNYQENVDLIKDIVLQMGQVGAQHATGLVVDPIYSFDVTRNSGQAGILTRLTTLHEDVDPLAVPSLIPNYGLEEICNNYNLAALELYYHPQENNAFKKKQLLAEVYDYCDYLDIHLLLKLIIYTPADRDSDQELFQQDQLQAVQELRSMTDVIALQYPFDPLAAATLTAKLDIPWVLQAQQEGYEDYKQELRICLENGAAGLIAGQSLWRELGQYKLEDASPDLEQVNSFINTTFQDRIIELMRIVDEIGQQRSE